MFFTDDSTNERIEEARELLYKIIKEFPGGIASNFLEQLYNKRYVQTGIANQLPHNWLALLRVAEEFYVQDVSSYTLLYRAGEKIPADELQQRQHQKCCEELLTSPISSSKHSGSQSSENSSANSPKIVKAEGKSCEGKECIKIMAPIAKFSTKQFEQVALSSLPQIGSPLEIVVVTALDPDYIFFRFKEWNIYCEYLSLALSRLPPSTELDENNFQPGQVFGAKIENSWWRVELVRQSVADPKYWIVYVVDAGYFYGVPKSELRPLTEAVTAFKKIFLAICKLEGVCIRGQQQQKQIASGEGGENINEMLPPKVLWPSETQHYLSEAFRPNSLKDKQIELIATSEWQIHAEKRIPMCNGKLLIASSDFGEQLVSMGLAQRK